MRFFASPQSLVAIDVTPEDVGCALDRIVCAVSIDGRYGLINDNPGTGPAAEGKIVTPGDLPEVMLLALRPEVANAYVFFFSGLA
jgi:hypothetical protein